MSIYIHLRFYLSWSLLSFCLVWMNISVSKHIKSNWRCCFCFKKKKFLNKLSISILIKLFDSGFCLHFIRLRPPAATELLRCISRHIRYVMGDGLSVIFLDLTLQFPAAGGSEITKRSFKVKELESLLCEGVTFKKKLHSNAILNRNKQPCLLSHCLLFFFFFWIRASSRHVNHHILVQACLA